MFAKGGKLFKMHDSFIFILLEKLRDGRLLGSELNYLKYSNGVLKFLLMRRVNI